MRKVDVYVSLKRYEVSDDMIQGARDMAQWYRKNGDENKAGSIEMIILQVDDDCMAIGQVWGKLNAYKNRFAKLVAA